MVLQVHYINIEDIDKTGDSSGVYVYYTKEKQERLAGVLSMHVDTNVPSFARSFQDVACKVSENKVCNVCNEQSHIKIYLFIHFKMDQHRFFNFDLIFIRNEEQNEKKTYDKA